MNDAKTKQQVIDKINTSNNILVTVSNDPSVDSLSAAIGLTLILNKLGKHTTAIFSGAIPPAITFLNPDKTFENSTDSLRDFIIALDKEKADHLRYKVEGDVVKIFITPYKTTITDKDLEFSQGDYNVELVLALGVNDQSHLDKALEAHGQILHDATVMTVSAGEQVSQLGSIDWHDQAASSLSEMLAGLTESFKLADDKEPVLDQQSATALLTGIVAETDRFSNTKTSSKVMSVAAQLMAAGADQQLIASKLQESHTIDQTGLSAPAQENTENAYGVADGGGIAISHNDETLTDIEKRVGAKPKPTAAEEKAPDTEAQLAQATPSVASAYALEPNPDGTPNEASALPIPGTTQPAPAAEDPIRHAYLSDEPVNTAPINGSAQAGGDTANVDIFSGNSNKEPVSVNDPMMPATDNATPAVPPAPAPISPDLAATLPQPPPLPDFSNLPPPVSLGGSTSAAAGYVPTPQPEKLGDILNDEKPATPPVQPAAQTGVPSDPGSFQIPGGVY